MNLLCALMVAGTCLQWHPEGTRKSDIAGTGEFTIWENSKYVIDYDESISGKRIARINILSSGARCSRADNDSPNREPLLSVKTHTRVFYSCTNQEAAEYKEITRRKFMSEIERQIEDSGAPK